MDMSDQVPLLSVSQRRKHVHAIVAKLGGHVNGNKLQTITDEPIHHIFSHIRHTMYVEYICVDDEWNFSNDDTTDLSVTKQWMSQRDMDQVGITSGVKKVLQAIDMKLKNRKDDSKS
jgi:adenine-specific DNA glycosylase